MWIKNQKAIKMKSLLIVLFISVIVYSIQANGQDNTEGDQVFFVVEDMPEFPGGDDALKKYIAEHVKYPEEAKKNGITGKVYVSFTVSKEGKVIDSEIARGASPALDKEALRVINDLPVWKPGKQKGKVVNVRYTVPINFALEDDK